MSAMQAISKAAESAGQKAPVTANKSLTTTQDFHTSLGDSIRQRVARDQELMDSFNYKYDKGQRVFTEDSAQKNWPPMTVLSRALEGNRMMRENPDDILSKKIIDELTGKPKRTPPEPGYRVRLEHSPDNWSEFLIPESAIKGSVDKAKGGLIRMAEGGSSNYHPDVQDALKAGRITPNQAKWMSNYARTAGNPEIGTAGIRDGISEKMMNYRNAVRAGEHTRPSWMEPIPKEVKIPYWATGKLDLDREGLRQLDKIPAMTKKAFNASEYSNTYPAGANDLNYYNELVKASQEAPDYQPYIDEINKIKERNPSLGKAKGGAIRMQVGGLSALANAGKAGTLANRLSRSESAGMRARQFADPLNPDDIMRMSEALGYAGAEGKTLNLTQADRSRVFGPNKGGTGFSGLQLTSPEHKKAKSTWGVGKPSHLTRLTKATDDDTIWSTFIGSPTQHMSNPVTTQRMYEAHRKANPSAKLVEDMNKMLNKAVDDKTGKPMFPNGIDISDPSSLNQAQTFNQRKLLAKAMVMGGEKKGEKATQEAFKIIKEETDPLLMESPTYAIGNRLFTIDKNSGLYRPDLNSAFPYISTGDDLGLLFEPAPLNLAAPQFVNQEKYLNRLDKRGRPSPISHKDLSSTTPKQFISEEYLTNLQKEGYKDGGSAEPKPFHDFDQIMKRKDGGTVNQSFEQQLMSALANYQPNPDMLVAPSIRRGGEVSDNTTPDMTDSGSINYGGMYAGGGTTRRYAEAGSVPAPTPQELEKMADAQGAAFGVFPQMANKRFFNETKEEKLKKFLEEKYKKEQEGFATEEARRDRLIKTVTPVLGAGADIGNFAANIPHYLTEGVSAAGNYAMSKMPSMSKPASVLDTEGKGDRVPKYPLQSLPEFDPFYGSAAMQRDAQSAGLMGDSESPIYDTAMAFLSPYAAVKAPKAIKGGLNMVKPVIKEAGDMASRAVVPMRRQFEPSTFTVESTADDLGQNTTYGFRQGVNDVLLGNPNLGTGKNKSREAVGTFMNPNKLIHPKGLTEINPMMAIDVRGAGTIGNVPSANKALRKQVGQLGEDLNQTSMAGHRFIPLMTNNIKDASSMLIKTPQGLNKDEIKQLAVLLGDDMVLAHNPRLGGVVVMPFGRVEKGQIPEEFLKAQSAANEVLGKRGKVQFGVSDFDKDRLFMEKTKGDYVQAGANQMSKEQQAQREKLQGLEKFLFPQSRSGIPGQVKAAPVGGLQPWSVGSDYPTSVIGIGNGSRVQYQPRNFSTGKEGSRYDTYMDAEQERAQMLDEFHRTLVPKYR